jgi:hypothetical protein
MDERNSVDSHSELDKTETVCLVSLRPVTLNAIGKITGKIYRFSGAGSEQDVDVRDAEHFLNQTMVSCCSGLTSKFFEIVVR